jgi:hypothetical protein
LAERPSAGNSFGLTSGQNVDNPNQQSSGNDNRALHFEAWNYLFADGHVKWLKPEATVDLNPANVGGATGDGTGTVSAPRGMWTILEND